jgi:large subunit ribosomal protein L24
MNKIRKGDEVVVISGRDKGRRGSMLKKHQKPNPQRQIQGGIVMITAPMAVSKVMLWNPVTKKGDRVGVRALADGRRVRYFKSNNEVVDAAK